MAQPAAKYNYGNQRLETYAKGWGRQYEEATREMRYRLKLCLPLGLGALGLLALTAGTWFAPGSARAQSVVMRLDPPSRTVDVGSGKFTVDVVVDGVTNLGSYEFQLTFDPKVVRFVGVENEPFLGSTGRTLYCPPPTLFYDQPGEPANRLRFSCGTLDPTPAGPDGSAVLATVTFAAQGAGTSPLTLIASTDNTGTSSVDGVNLNAVSQSGEVTVVGEGPAATAEPDEPTAIPTEKYIPPIHSTPAPGVDLLLTPDPGETPMAHAMPGREMTNLNGTSGTSGGGGSAAADSSGGSSSAGGSPRAGSGPPEDEAARWPTFAGGLLAVAGAGLLAFSILLKHGGKLSDDKREL